MRSQDTSPSSLDCARKCGFQYLDYVSTNGFSGGIWLFWKDCSVNPFNLFVIYKSARFIACSINFLRVNVPFISIFIFAPGSNNHKEEFWNDLIQYTQGLLSPFIILGDFNEISNVQDKMGGAAYHSNRNKMMQSILDRTASLEIPFIGPRFTWRKKNVEQIIYLKGWTKVLLVCLGEHLSSN